MVQMPMGSELTPEDVERISNKYFPKCPNCGGKAKFIIAHFEEKRELIYEVDGSSGIAYERERALISIQTTPEYRERLQPNRSDYPKLECEDCEHQWVDATTEVSTNWADDLGYLKIRKSIT